MKLGEAFASMNVETVPSGSVALDIALGVGGFPRGLIIEIYGPESSGKTTVALHAVAEVQKRGGQAALIHAEHVLDPVYASKSGVNIDELLISQPDTEKGTEISEALFVAVLWTLSWWTRWLPSCPRMNSRVKWEILTSVRRRV